MWSSKTLAPSLVLVFLGLLGAAPAGAADGKGLPDSLGQWYKPQAQRQVWLHTMFALRRELQAVREYAGQRDAERLSAWARRLDAHYRELGEMVPEWREETAPEQMRELRRLAEAGDFDATLRAADRLERDCRSCHRQYRALAALRYRWPEFDRLGVADGRGGQRSYPEHMEALSISVNRIKIASEDRRWDTAVEALAALRVQLEALGQGCEGCHRDAAPRERILGAATATTLNRLEQALAARDAKSTGRQLGTAAVQVCARCHGVHRLLSDVRDEVFDH